MEALSGLDEPSLITILAVTLIALFAAYFKFKTSSSPVGKKLPPGSFGLPLIGESISFIRAQKQDKTGEWIQTRIQKYGPVFKTSLMGSKTVVLTGQAGNRFVFSGSDNGIAGNQVATAAKVFGKHSIFEVSGSRHKLVRGALMDFLKLESIQRFVGEMDSLIQKQLFQELNGKDMVQMVGLMKKITFKVTCSLFFGLPEGQEKDALLEDFTLATKGAWAIPLNIPGTVFYKAMQARSRISKILMNLIHSRQKEDHKNKASQANDFISVFLHLRDEDGEPLQEDEILDNLITIIIASHDTTTILLSLILRHISTDPKIFSEVLQEHREVVKAVEASGEGKLGWSEIQMMKHTWRTAQELMRLTPPVFGNFKCASRDTSFDGFDIPKGWKVFWTASGTHMDNKIFEDPNKFDPSRFEGSSKSSYPPYTYIPFGAGPRICPGLDFARVEVLLIIHHLITNYSWTQMIENEPIRREPMPYPAMGLPVKLHQK